MVILLLYHYKPTCCNLPMFGLYASWGRRGLWTPGNGELWAHCIWSLFWHSIRTGTIRTIREGSFQIRGPQFFNSIPANIRGLTWCRVNTFKHKLDDYLKNIPDTPKIPGCTIQTDTNSITSMRGSRKSWAIQLRRSHRLGQRDYSQTLNLNFNLNLHEMPPLILVL